MLNNGSGPVNPDPLQVRVGSSEPENQNGSPVTQDTNNTAGEDIDIGLFEDAEIIDDED